LPIAQNGPSETAPVVSTTANGNSRRRILIVEDNEDASASLEMLLRIEGQEVHRAKDGKTALQVALEIAPEMVLLDIGLPDMDGYEIIRRLRASTGALRPVVVALTGYGQAEDRRRTKEAGFDHHLTKPVALQEVMQIIASLNKSPDDRSG